jgi:hypothetical protein
MNILKSEINLKSWGSEENSMPSTQKETTSLPANACYFWREVRSGSMALKVCANAACAFHGHVLYATGTRCRLCGWDLQRTLPKSETSKAPERVAIPRRATA